MSYPAVFTVLASAELFSIFLIFIFKDMLHSVLALSMAFFFNSLLFLVLGQPLLALIQLLVMVGGISIYLFVGVASAGFSRFKHTNYILLAVISILLFGACFYGAVGMQFPVQQQNALSSDAVASYLTSSISQLYVIAFVLFGVAIGSIAFLKKAEKIK
jgi:NADH:ubiquinone oxidoreductase subunit 6 (subunit J)